LTVISVGVVIIYILSLESYKIDERGGLSTIGSHLTCYTCNNSVFSTVSGSSDSQGNLEFSASCETPYEVQEIERNYRKTQQKK